MISNVVTQLRTTNLDQSIRFYTDTMGFALEFRFQDFYAGIRAGLEVFHLKLVDEPDPSIDFVRSGGHFHLYFETDDVEAEADRLRKKGVRPVQDVHATAWGARQFIMEDDQGHTLHVAQNVA
jgi:catechol 2,3-dioxygenase-like lactoylglutathione lyase family enzyme